MKQKSDENIKIDTKIRESDDYQFLQEKIKERPVNRKKLLKNTLMTLGFAVIFGAVACATFILLEPVLGNLISKDENKTVVVLPPEDEEMLPEDMVWADDELEEDGQSNISNAVSTVGAGDNFNAGIIYGLLKYDVRRDDLASLNAATWDKVIACGMAFAAEVCRSVGNSISLEFAKSL